MPDADLILAAGTLIWRRADEGVEVGVVHRPRYDDWSLPKGKPEAGEHLTVTALRELREETGLVGRLSRPLGTVGYLTSLGPKVVHYWTLEVSDPGAFVPNEECDALAWLSPAEAAQRLTYPHDVSLLARALSSAVDTSTVLVVRHAQAGDRRLWRGQDAQRPLDEVGLVQAATLSPVLAAFGPVALRSADRVRCIQTLEPLSLDLEQAIEGVPGLDDESVLTDVGATADLVRAWSTAAPCTAVCSQGDAIPELVKHLCRSDDLPPARPRYPARKGSVWVLAFTAGRLVATDYLPHGRPGTW